MVAISPILLVAWQHLVFYSLEHYLFGPVACFNTLQWSIDEWALCLVVRKIQRSFSISNE